MKKLVVILGIMFANLGLCDSIQTVDGLKATGYLGHILGGDHLRYKNIVAREDLPESFDYRETEKMPEVRNQGSCGSCWAFAITRSLETSIIFKGNAGELNLSEQQLVSCNKEAYGCSGGFMESAQYVVDNGLGLEKDFPYTASNAKCKKIPVAAQPKSYRLIGEQGKKPSADQIKTALVDYGPVFVTVAAGSGWNGDSAELTYCKNRSTNHMVNIVGWTAKGEWIMNNSWGSNWGDKGYAVMKFGCDKIADEAGFVTLE